LLTRTSRARCHIRFGCVTLALVVTLTHNPRWVVTYLLIGWRHYDVIGWRHKTTSGPVLLVSLYFRWWKNVVDIFILTQSTNVTDTQTDRQTDTARRHRPRFCIASRGKNQAFSSAAGPRTMIPTIFGTVIEEVRAIFAPPKFFDPIGSYAAMGY